MYEIYEKLLREHGVKSADVARATGISPSTLADWKHGRIKVLKADKLALIADYFGVTLDYLTTGRVSDEANRAEEEQPSYYLNDEVAEIAQKLHDDEYLRLMFMAARDMPKEDIVAFLHLMQKWRGEDEG